MSGVCSLMHTSSAAVAYKNLVIGVVVEPKSILPGFR